MAFERFIIGGSMCEKVGVVILNYNQNKYTIDCIKSILDSDYHNIEIVLVDNGSEDIKYQELKKMVISVKDQRVTLTKIERNRGYVGGINYGLEIALSHSPYYFLIMNNDTLLDKEAINELIKTCKMYNDRAIVTGKVYHFDKKNVIQDIGYSFKSKKKLTFNRLGLDEIDCGQYEEIHERDMLDDVFWLFPVRLYEQIGGYCNYFWFNAEQVDFALRAKKLLFKLVYTPKAKLWHKGSVSIGGREFNPRLVYWDIQSSLILRFIHLEKKTFVIFLGDVLQSVLRTSFKAYFKFLAGDSSLIKYARAKRAALWYFLVWLFKRNENSGKNLF